MGLCVSYVLSALIKGQVDRALAYLEYKLGHGRVRVDGVVHLLKRHLVLNGDRHLRDQVAGLMSEYLAADDDMVVLPCNYLDTPSVLPIAIIFSLDAKPREPEIVLIPLAAASA